MRSYASGKLILVGEHAVVYGHPALAFAVDLGTTLTLTAHEGPTTLNDDLDDARVLAAVCDLLSPNGLHVELESTLPIGRGMGSSASLAVALARASALYSHETLTPAELFTRAMRVERRFHGNPSGIDVAVSLYGGVLRFCKGPPVTHTSLPAPDWAVVVLDTEKRGDTGQMVAQVAARRPAIDPYLERIGALVAEAEACLHDPAALGLLLDENQSLLAQIGVSTPEIDQRVHLAKQAGAYGAKLSGAGGGGVVIALVDDPEPLLRASARHRIPATVVRPVDGP